jgi:hypothetical protein
VSITVGTNSYIDIAGADEYFSARLHADAWANASADDKEKALKQATKIIDRQLFKGRPVDLSQPLAFPRCYLAPGAPASQYRFDILPGWWCETDVPQAVKDACCEEALALIAADSERAKLIQDGVISFSIGDLSETYRPNAMRGLHSLEAQEYMRPYIAGAAAIL